MLYNTINLGHNLKLIFYATFKEMMKAFIVFYDHEHEDNLFRQKNNVNIKLTLFLKSTELGSFISTYHPCRPFHPCLRHQA